MFILVVYFIMYVFYLHYKEEKIKTRINKNEIIEDIFDVLVTSSLLSVLGVLLVSVAI